MMKYAAKKIALLFATLLLVSIVTFAAFCFLPGDAALVKGGLDASSERIEELREEMGLNDPAVKRYFSWILDAIRGDFGESFQYDGLTVSELIAARLPYTLLLTAVAVVLIIVFSIPLGLAAAKGQNRVINGTVNVITQISMAVPPFFAGMLITYIFGILLGFFMPGSCPSPSEDFAGALFYMIFPAVAIAIPKIAMTVKYLKASARDELEGEYILLARSKGLSEWKIMVSHVAKNSIIPVITFIGMTISDVIAGSIIIEQVFSIPGLGRLLVSSILNRDYPVAQASVLFVASITVIIGMVSDIIYHLVDPRIRTERRDEA